jgi:hypothetical protein
VLEATVYQGDHDRNHKLLNIGSTDNWQHMCIFSLNVYIGSRYWVYNYMLNVFSDSRRFMNTFGFVFLQVF